MDSLLAVINKVHYQPFRYISEAALAENTDRIRKSIGDSISVKEFTRKIFALTSLFQDGHMAPALGQSALRTELLKKQFLPARLISDDEDQVWVHSAADAFPVPAGARITSINGRNLATLKSEARSFVGGLPQWKKEFSDRIFSYILFFQGVQAPFEIRYKMGDSEKTVRLQEGVNFSDALAFSLPSLKQASYSFRIIENKIGYFNFISMSGDYVHFMNFLDSAFTEMRKRDIQHFAVDLRNNSGGDSRFGDILLSFVSQKPFALNGIKYWKISRSYKNMLLARGDTANNFHQQPDGSIWQLGNCQPKEKMVNVDSVFTGRVYLLTGPFTFSSANMLADGARHYQLATIIGEATGESVNDFGEVYSFELPQSKIKVNTTTSFDLGAACDETLRNAVAPHVPIKTTISDILQNHDPVWQYVLQQVVINRSN